jgi:FkbM family methyltransferase
MKQKEKLTILIPYRNREDNLNVFIPYFHNFMKTNFSHINYDIVIIEQGNNKKWNKGLLYNIGYLITSGNTDYYALHDVDQLPISADYRYYDEPQHLCVNVLDQSDDGTYKNPYKKFNYGQKGGVITINKELYKKCNGHSNNYWGWGFEDDDFSFRLYDINHHLIRYGNKMNHQGLKNNDKGYYVTLHNKIKIDTQNMDYIRNKEYATDIIKKDKDWRIDGLNTTSYILKNIINNPHYTKYIVDFTNTQPIYENESTYGNIDIFAKKYNDLFHTPPKNILEIGSRDGNDSNYLKKYFNIKDENVYLVEPNPPAIKNIKEKYPKYKLFEFAISQKIGISIFNSLESNNNDISGMSSLMDKNEKIMGEKQIENLHKIQKKIKVLSISGEMLLELITDDIIDLVKIDVEGLTFSVLRSFGEYIKKLKYIHMEAEYIQHWENQVTYDKIYEYMVNMGFEEHYKTDYPWKQCDTIWYNKNMINNG